MARGPAVDRGPAAAGVLGDVRRGPELAQLHDEVGDIVGPIGADRDRPATGLRGDQLDRRPTLGEARCAGQLGLDHQTMAVLHQHMAHEAQPGFLATALAEQPRVRIGARGMAVIGPPLAMEVPARIAAASKALGSRTGLQQR